MQTRPEKTPDEEKKKLALIFAGFITFLIFLGWIFYFIGDAKRELDKTSENRVTLFNVFEDNIGKFADNFVNQFKTIPEKFVGSSTDVFISTTTQATTSINN